MKRREDSYEDVYENKIAGFFWNAAGFMFGLGVAVLVAIFCLYVGGCSTLKTRRNAGDIRNTDSFVLGELEGAVSAFDDGIGRAIRESRGIADEVDRLEFLFNRYEQQALRLRNEVDNLRKQIENKGEDYLGRGDSHID